MDLLISKAIEQKLKNKHKVSMREIAECLRNRPNKALIDDRQQHRTFPPTQWFIAETAAGRELKVVFIQLSANQIALKTAYDADEIAKRFYKLRIRE